MKTEQQIKIGTRGSKLALVQTDIVVAQLKSIGITNVQIIKIKTTGDRQSTEPIAEIGGKGVFVGEIEDALLSEAIDIAVHSLKDMPAVMDDRLSMAAYLRLHSADDLLISNETVSLHEMPAGSRIGTSSPRREAQLKRLRPDCHCTPIRGNVDTRLHKLETGDYDAIVLAAAGLERLGIEYRDDQVLPMTPAPGQGVLAVQARSASKELLQRLRKIDNSEQRTISTIERALLSEIGATCTTPIGMKSELVNDTITLHLFLSDPEGNNVLEDDYSSSIENALKEISSSIRSGWFTLTGKELRL